LEPWFSKFYGLIWLFIVTLSIKVLSERTIKKGEAKTGEWNDDEDEYILKRKDQDCGWSEIFDPKKLASRARCAFVTYLSCLSAYFMIDYVLDYQQF
jgi:hypothetical protein